MMQSFMSDINRNINKRIVKVKTVLRPMVFEAVYNSPTMISIRGGKLRLDFGIPHDPTFQIASSVSRAISARFRPFKYINGFIFGEGVVSIQPSDYFELLNLPGSVVITEKGDQLPWLDWLLNYGDQVIIVNFGVKYSKGKGRTGGAIMVPNGTPFRVDPAHAGTSEDNFIVRALNDKRAEIERAIWQTILN